MIKKMVGLVFFVMLIVVVFADESENYIETSIIINRTYFDTNDNTTVTNFSIKFGDHFKDLKEVVLWCERDGESGYWQGDRWEEVDWNDEDEGDWRIGGIDDNYFETVEIDKVTGGNQGINLTDLTQSIYNLSETTVSSLQFATKLADSEKIAGKCQGDLESCNKFNDEYKGSANQYKELFENTSIVHQSTESELSSCRGNLQSKDTDISTCGTNLENEKKSKTSVGLVWALVGAVAGYLFGRRKDAMPAEFAQFPDSAP